MATRTTTSLQWSQLARLDDASLPLWEAALLIARDEYPDLNIESYRRRIARMGRRAMAAVANIDDATECTRVLNDFVYGELGLTGNHDDYLDPRNSYLNDVLDRRTGNPISLAVVHIELARRAGIPLEGVSFPGHFLVRLATDDGILVIDPFNRGRPLDADELKQRARPHIGDLDLPDSQLLDLLAPASNRAILARMLRNLKGLYSEQEDWGRALRCTDRLIALDDTQPHETRDRGLLYLKLGHLAAARRDLDTYLATRPESSEDRDAARLALIEASATRVSVH
ncbi:MAG: tetratricopeptide repeat protein [Lysobacterales bacterium]